MKTLLLLSIALTLLLSGCSTLEADLPGGGRIKRVNFLNSANQAPIDITLADGTKIKSEGSSHEQTQVAGRALDLAAGLLGK